MHPADKFYSELLKLAGKKDSPDFNRSAAELFCRTAKQYDRRTAAVADDIAAYWLESKAGTSVEQEEAADWFYKVFRLLDGSFEDDMDFSGNDWENLRFIFSGAAEEIDMDLLTSVMQVIVERKKL